MEMEKELRADDLFVKKPIKTAEEMIAGAEYIATVKLSSGGKLGLPAVLHVKDYSFADTMLFAKAVNDNESKIILSILKNVVYEDIDISKVTSQDALEILMTIQGTFYSNSIDGLRYYVDDTLKGDALNSQENISTATIPINSIKTVPLGDVKTPITLEYNSYKVKFDYPRLIHDVQATEYIEQKYAEEENKLADIANKVKLHTATLEELKAYNDMTGRKTADFIEILNALQILEYNNKILESIDDKVQAIRKIPGALMTIFNSILSTKFVFGVDPEVTFIDNITEKPITRRFNFRFSHFLQTMEYKNADDVRISFG